MSVQKCTHLGSKETSTVYQDLAQLATACNLHTMRYQIDGSRSAILEEFYEEVSRALIPGESWGRNLDAFNDDLRGGFGSPLDGFTVDWKNHALSTATRLRRNCSTTRNPVRDLYPSNRDRVLRDLERARTQQGPTGFDWLVGINRIYGRGGQEVDDGIEILLDRY